MAISPEMLAEQPRDGDWIATYTGRKFWVMDPRMEEVHIHDIAHGLALTCRFGGQCHEYYSVAQHSVLVSQNVEPEFALLALLHDAAEAYVGDVVNPLKRELYFAKVNKPEFDAPRVEFKPFRDLEHRILKCILRALDIPEYTAAWGAIQKADRRALSTEARDLMDGATLADWRPLRGSPPFSEKVTPLGPMEAKVLFLDTFTYLNAKRTEL